jgi:hypothetical protein
VAASPKGLHCTAALQRMPLRLALSGSAHEQRRSHHNAGQVQALIPGSLVPVHSRGVWPLQFHGFCTSFQYCPFYSMQYVRHMLVFWLAIFGTAVA